MCRTVIASGNLVTPLLCAARLGEAVGHYAALVIAENPVEEHRQFLLRQATVDEAGDSTAPPPGAWDAEAQRQGSAAALRGRPSVLGAKRASTLGGGQSEPVAPKGARVRRALHPLSPLSLQLHGSTIALDVCRGTMGCHLTRTRCASLKQVLQVLSPSALQPSVLLHHPETQATEHTPSW